MKNYYEILEVDVKASKEVIEKAYKVLAKKYHPDTQSEDKKEWAEAQFKEINEAYEVLSNIDKRKDYDVELDYDKNSVFQALCTKNEHLQNLVDELQHELEYIKKLNNSYTSNARQASRHTTKATVNYYNEPQRKTQEPYHYSNYGTIPREKTVYYEAKIPHTKNRWKDLLAFLITIICIIGIAFLLWKIPFTNRFLISLYEDNPPIKALADFFIGIFSK